MTYSKKQAIIDASQLERDMISTESMHYDSQDDVLTGEASTLQWRPLQAPHMFTLKSHKTDRMVAMELKETTRDREGDILHWTYKSNTIPTTVVVFND